MMLLSAERDSELRSRSRLLQEEAAELLGVSPCVLSSWLTQKKDFLKGTYYIINRRRIFITEKLIQWMEDGGENCAANK